MAKLKRKAPSEEVFKSAIKLGFSVAQDDIISWLKTCYSMNIKVFESDFSYSFEVFRSPKKSTTNCMTYDSRDLCMESVLRFCMKIISDGN
jgi:hypothetical protein